VYEPRKHIVDLGLELVETVAGVVRLLRRSCAARHHSYIRCRPFLLVEVTIRRGELLRKV